jgi:hypothetical protein
MLPSGSFTVAISLPPADVGDRLPDFCTALEERLEAPVDVVDVPVARGTRHALAVPVGIEADLLAVDAHLRAVAYRMLGSPGEADDAVQEAWLRLSRSDAAAIENLGGWLTTVVSRVSLDMLRSRSSRREDPAGAHKVQGSGSVPEAVAGTFSGRALGAQPALIEGAVGVVWVVAGRPKVAWDFTINRGRILHIDMLAASDSLDDLDLTVLGG